MVHKGKNKLAIILGSAFLTVVSAAIFVTGLSGNWDWFAKQNKAGEEAAKNIASEGSFKCPLDGTRLKNLPENRPVAVVIDDLPAARPQSGLTSADIVYETLAEGGITRLLAVYYHGEAPRVGPVRSARPYFIQIAGSLNAVLIHAGGSPDALNYMKANNTPHIDEFRFSRGFWRDRSRKAPHNLYSDTNTLHRLVQEAGLNTQVTVPVLNIAANTGSVDSSEGGLESHKIEVFFSKSNKVTYVYDSQKKVYRRLVSGKPHVDANTNSQISPRNILVQFVKTKVVDDQGRLDIELVGQGRALFFTSGQVVEAVWQKTTADQTTSYQAEDGNMPEVLPGQTWIELIPEDTKVIF